MEIIHKNRVKEKKAIIDRNTTNLYYGGNGNGAGTIIGGNYLPAIKDENGNYVVDLAQVKFNGNIFATGEVTAFKTDGTTPIPPEPPTGATTLGELKDVAITAVKNGEVLQYDANKQKWVNATVSGGSEPVGPADWNTMINKPDVFKPDTSYLTDYPTYTYLSSYYVNNVNFRMHTNSESKHTNADEKTKWNNAYSEIESHVVDQDMHVSFDDKARWTDTCDLYDIHAVDNVAHVTQGDHNRLNKLTPAFFAQYDKMKTLLDQVSVLEDGTVQFKKNIVAAGEITAHGTLSVASEGEIAQ